MNNDPKLSKTDAPHMEITHTQRINFIEDEQIGKIKGSDIDIKARNLPHWHKHSCTQFITFHLADSLPLTVREKLVELKKSFIKQHPQPWSKEVQIRFNKIFPSAVNQYLDAGYGSCIFRRKDCAEIMAQVLKYYNNNHYKLRRFVIMPNHVHVLIELIGSCSTSQICKSWKGYSARQINKLTGNTGKLWHHESWDRMIRNANHYDNVIKYIDKNISQGGILWL